MIILLYDKVEVMLQTLGYLLFTVYFLTWCLFCLLFAKPDNFLGSILHVLKFK